MSYTGLLALAIAFAAEAISIICLLAGHYFLHSNHRDENRGHSLIRSGCTSAFVATALLTLCCALLVFCFMTGDTSLQYVVENRSDSTGSLGWLYRLSGLWAGREGSLLFWTWLISLFNLVIGVRTMRRAEALDTMALAVAQLVLAAFTGIMLFSESNMPFTAMSPVYFDAAGELANGAQLWGMNALLEHWAMAVHPPTLFIGYAGLTVPFAYAIAALIVNDSSRAWVEKSSRFAISSLLFLSLGIGLGAIWAYSVLGWGGYWGWDPVENASLLPWLICLALVHSFTVYRQRGTLKRWSVMCACLAFAFVIVGTFITRSGIVQSVHAFASDNVSTNVFLSMIVLSLAAGIIGLVYRWKSFGPPEGEKDDFDSMASRDVAYYFNNVVMVVFAVLLLYMTLAPALPAWLPFGGQAFSSTTYEGIARPLGIVYCALVAIGPLLSWGKTTGRQFWRRARVPALCALVLFVLLIVYFVVYLMPSYNALIEEGGAAAGDLLPAWYCYTLTIVGFAVASLLFFNALFMLIRTLRIPKRRRASSIGGFIAHLSMAVILVGLIGSSMYVTEKSFYLPYDSEADVVSEDIVVQDFTLVYTSSSVDVADDGQDRLYVVELDVYRGDDFVGHVAPAVRLNVNTMSENAIASVITFPDRDLFVVYRGTNEAGELAIDVRVNPCILLVWIGFGLMMAGMVVSLVGRRRGDALPEAAPDAPPDAVADAASGAASNAAPGTPADAIPDASPDAPPQEGSRP